MSEFMEGRKVRHLYMASTGGYIQGEGMKLFYETSSFSIERGEWQEPWVRWEDPDGTVVLVNMRHVEQITFEPEEASDE